MTHLVIPFNIILFSSLIGNINEKKWDNYVLTTECKGSNINNMFRRLNRMEANMNNIDKDSLYRIFMEILRLHYYRTHVLLDEVGVYPGQPPMLFILNQEDGQSQKELAARLKLRASTITVMLKRMEKANLVVRRQDNEDQRISRAYITEKGRQVCKKTNEIMRTIEKECFGNFTVEEKIILRRLLIQMKNNLLIANE